MQSLTTPDVEAGVLIRLLYKDLVEVEALAVTADEAVTNLPPRPRGRHGRTLARLYTLVGKTSGRAQGALERGEELVRPAHDAIGGPGPEAPRALTRTSLRSACLNHGPSAPSSSFFLAS